jgi:hypothetical protein
MPAFHLANRLASLEMALHQLNELLEQIGEANDGADHGSQYALYQLPFADTLQEALGGYFSGLSTSNCRAQPAERWNIRSTPVYDSDEALRLVARHWFYELEYSPNVDAVHAETIIADFLTLLRSVVADASVFEVRVAPPMWYDCVWQDFAFDGGKQRWLLHLGFSD